MADDRQPDAGQGDVGEGPLARWSRRKRLAADVQTARPQESALESPVQATASTAEPPVKTDADMPPLAELRADSRLADFFSPGVSEELRHRALRRVFSQARYNVTDGLDDYAGDYTRYRPLGDLVTAGLRWHRQRRDELAAANAAGGPEDGLDPAVDEPTLAAQEPVPASVASDPEVDDPRTDEEPAPT